MKKMLIVFFILACGLCSFATIQYSNDDFDSKVAAKGKPSNPSYFENPKHNSDRLTIKKDVGISLTVRNNSKNIDTLYYRVDGGEMMELKLDPNKDSTTFVIDVTGVSHKDKPYIQFFVNNSAKDVMTITKEQKAEYFASYDKNDINLSLQINGGATGEHGSGGGDAPAGTPLPGVWALIVCGGGAIGMAMRRRKKAQKN